MDGLGKVWEAGWMNGWIGCGMGEWIDKRMNGCKNWTRYGWMGG